MRSCSSTLQEKTNLAFGSGAAFQAARPERRGLARNRHTRFRRPARRLLMDTVEPQRAQIERLGKGLDRANRVPVRPWLDTCQSPDDQALAF